jgi:peptide/nickel transport system substrate-binding protein
MTIEQKLRQLATKSGMTRRGFMQRALALGATTALATTLANQTFASEPKQGGRFRVGLGHGATSDSLDPATFLDLYMQTVNASARNNLTEVAQDGSLIPELAESFDTADATTWQFNLRQGVEFHNGKTMDSNDVMASITHHRGENSKSPAKELLKSIVEMKADGANAVVFTLSEGNADFPFILSDYHIPIMPVSEHGVDWQSGTGTGAYVLESFEPGVRSTLKRNPNFFKEGFGHFDEVEVITIADVAARTNALTTGEIDAMDRVDLKTAHLLERQEGVRLVETSGTQHFTFTMRCDTPPFDNVHVRLALKHAIDREAIVRTILRGHGTLGNDHPISSANRYHAGGLEQRAYDPDMARHHLKQAGLDSLSIDLSAADAAFAGAVDAAVLYKEHAAAAGIDINVVREPDDGYWSNVWMQKAFSACYWSGRPTENWIFSQIYAADASWNDTFWKHDRFNELLIQARAELDTEKRREMYVEMQRIIHNEGGVCLPLFQADTMAYSEKLHVPEVIGNNWELDGHKNAERWWFA